MAVLCLNDLWAFSYLSLLTSGVFSQFPVNKIDEEKCIALTSGSPRYFSSLLQLRMQSSDLKKKELR